VCRGILAPIPPKVMVMRYIILLIALLCAACSASLPSIKPYRMDIQQGNVVTSKMMLQLRPGMTKSQVRFIMGTPLIQDTFHAERWDYFYQMRKGGVIIEQRRVILDFDNQLLSKVRGDVIAQGSGEAGTEAVPGAAMVPGNAVPASQPKKEKSLLDKLKFWNSDDKQEAKPQPAPAEPVAPQNKQVAPVAPAAPAEPKPAATEPVAEPVKTEPVTPAAVTPAAEPEKTPVLPEIQPQPELIPEPLPEPVAVPEAVKPQPVKIEPAKPEPVVPVPTPKPVAVPEPVKPQPAKVEPAKPEPVAPAPIPEPAAKPVVPEQKAPQVSTPKTSAPETKPVSKPVAKPKAAPEPAPVPDKDLPPEEDPSYFERMLEKIGF